MKESTSVYVFLFILLILVILLGINQHRIIEWQKSDSQIKINRFLKLENKNADIETEFRKNIQTMKKVEKNHKKFQTLFKDNEISVKEFEGIKQRIERLDFLSQQLTEGEKLLDFKISQMDSSIEKSKLLQLHNIGLIEKKLNESKTEIAILKKQNEIIIGLLYQTLSKKEKLLKEKLKSEYPELLE